MEKNIYIGTLLGKGLSQTEGYKTSHDKQVVFTTQLLAEGKMLAGGVALDSSDQFTENAMFLLLASSYQEAEDIMANCPLVLDGYSNYTLTGMKPAAVSDQLK